MLSFCTRSALAQKTEESSWDKHTFRESSWDKHTFRAPRLLWVHGGVEHFPFLLFALCVPVRPFGPSALIDRVVSSFPEC